MSDRGFSMGSSTDDPPNSRLFIVGSKSLCEDDYRAAFEEFGAIEEIWSVRDRHTRENKGITYIKYSKTSEAAKAMEAMNGKTIGGLNRSIRVLIAASRDQGSKRDSNEEERIQRLFVIVPKTMTDNELYEYFSRYGDLEYANIMRDRETRESKGFAYVKYFRFSHAATAYEQCDRKYKPVFAEPRKMSRIDDRHHIGSFTKLHLPPVHETSNGGRADHHNHGYTKLIAIVSPLLNQDQLWKLFDIVPDLDYCEMRLEGRPQPERGVATVVYRSSKWAAHAKEKIHGLEYPPGHRIIVKPDYDERRTSENSSIAEKPDILKIAETIAQATNLIEAAGLPRDVLQVRLDYPSSSNDNLLSVNLPDAKPLAPIDMETVARCFFVCSSTPPPVSVLKDAFSRFGNLIDVFVLNNKNCGFAKYACVESAENAIKTLHGIEIWGIRLKVMRAEEREDNDRKRQRLEK